MSSAYFVTAVTQGRRNILQSDRMARLFLHTIMHYRDAGKFAFHAFVVMPDHFHILITPPESLERAVQLIKGGFSYRARKELGFQGEVWTSKYHDRRVRDENEFAEIVRYIHQNPVRRGLARMADEYPYSSAWRPVTPAAEAASLHRPGTRG